MKAKPASVIWIAPVRLNNGHLRGQREIGKSFILYRQQPEEKEKIRFETISGKQAMSGKRHNGELEFIRQIRTRAGLPRGAAVSVGIGDDCALLRVRPGEEVAITTDLSIDGRHFRMAWHPPEAVGHRTLARGLSDLAAMGARPLAAFVSLGLPRELLRGRRSWADRFYDGLLVLASAHNCPLAGGDLSESPLALADIVLAGTVPRGCALLRSGARPGDLIYVTGTLGGAAAGLHALAGLDRTSGTRPLPLKLTATMQPHLYPQPRIAQGQWLQRRRGATACMDISDGLSIDLHRLCDESRVSAEIDAGALPISPGANLEQALFGGEDYELLFTARSDAKLPRSIAGVPITAIGRILRRKSEQSQVSIRNGAKLQPLAPGGWEHFAV
jgi:thiamine-monophosphate kinase